MTPTENCALVMSTIRKNQYLFLTFTLVFLTKDSLGMPLADTDEGMNYLMRYGYMSTSSEDMTEAIRRMQSFSGLNITGELDSKTIEKMREKRCGMPDMQGTGQRVRRYSLFGTKWSQNDLTYQFENFPADNDLTEPETRNAIERAFKLWSDVTPLTFTETDGFPVIDIQFVAGDHGDGDAFDGSGGVLAHAFFPAFGIGGDAHFDEDELWVSSLEIDSITSNDDIDLYQVAAHEFGHSLGLSHSEDPDALMAPFYRGFIKDLELSSDDILGIQALYGANPDTPTVADMPDLVPVTTNSPAPAPPGVTTPDPCPAPATFNAATRIRGEYFIFEGDLFWRFSTPGQVDTSVYPATTNSYFLELPSGSVDAAYERISDGIIVFIIGSEYWFYDGINKVDGYPKPLTDFGFPSDMTIDAAVSWSGNGKTYFFSGDQYWRYNELEIDFDYPRKIADSWNGLPDNLDAVLEDANGDLYFIKDEEVFNFNTTSMEVISGYPKLATVEFFGCPEDDSTSTAVLTCPTHLSLFLTVIYVFFSLFSLA